MFLFLKNNDKGGIGSVMGDRYVKSDEKKKILYIDATNFYGWAMSHSPAYDGFKFHEKFKLDGILNTPDDSDFGYIFVVDLKDPEF